MPSPQIKFRALSPLNDELTIRAEGESDPALAEIARRDLMRYYAMQRMSLQRLSFTHDEAQFLADALNGVITTPETAALLWATINNAGGDPALVQKLRSLTPFDAMAVADAVEQFWLMADGAIDDRLRVVNLWQKGMN